MSRDELLKELSGVSELIRSRPWWQRNLLDECSKSTSDVARPVPVISNLRETDLINCDDASVVSRVDVGH